MSYVNGILACAVAFALVRWYLRSADSKELSKYRNEMSRIDGKAAEPEAVEEERPEDIARMQKLWIKGGYLLMGPNGFIRELLPSEQATISLLDTFNPVGYAETHLEQVLVPQEEAERSLAWMREDDKRTEAFSVWWKTATYEQRLVIVKKYFNHLLPEVLSRWGSAEDVAGTDDIGSKFYCTMLARTAREMASSS